MAATLRTVFYAFSERLLHIVGLQIFYYVSRTEEKKDGITVVLSFDIIGSLVSSGKAPPIYNTISRELLAPPITQGFLSLPKAQKK